MLQGMAWTWLLKDAAGEPTTQGAEFLVAQDSVAGEQVEFDSQGDAESFLGEVWRDLFAAGVDSVALLEDTKVVYAMSLRPPEL